MYPIRFTNANTFDVSYTGSMSFTGSVSGQVVVSSFSSDPKTYGFYNKYLKNDRSFLLLREYHPNDYSFWVHKLDSDRTPFKNSDFISRFQFHSVVASPSVTGVLAGKGYQCLFGYNTIPIPSLTGTQAFLFSGWVFPFEKTVLMAVIDRPDTSTGDIGTWNYNTSLAYTMSQSSFYAKVRDHQANRSNKSVTRVSDNIMQFIQGKPTFITSVGLYDDDSNLLAVGKFSSPIQKLDFVPMSFKMRFFC